MEQSAKFAESHWAKGLTKVEWARYRLGMKLGSTLLFAIATLGLQNASACPNLAGEYLCLINDGRQDKIDLFTLKQWTVKTEPGVTYFGTDYRSIPGGGDVYRADATGIPDGWGWTNRCTKDSLVSIRYDGAAIAELYLDAQRNLIFTDNGVVTQSCSPKTVR